MLRLLIALAVLIPIGATAFWIINSYIEQKIYEKNLRHSKTLSNISRLEQELGIVEEPEGDKIVPFQRRIDGQGREWVWANDNWQLYTTKSEYDPRTNSINVSSRIGNRGIVDALAVEAYDRQVEQSIYLNHMIKLGYEIPSSMIDPPEPTAKPSVIRK